MGVQIPTPESEAEQRAREFVRDILENTFGQKTTDAEVNEVARRIVKLIPSDQPPE